MTKEKKKTVTKKENATNTQSVGHNKNIDIVVNGGYSLGIKAFKALNVHGGRKKGK